MPAAAPARRRVTMKTATDETTAEPMLAPTNKPNANNNDRDARRPAARRGYE